MTYVKKISVLGVTVLLLAFLIQAVAFKQTKNTAIQTTQTQSTPLGKVGPSREVDGQYYVYVTGVNQTVEDSVLLMRHVTYFDGPEARVSAANEVICTDTIETCVPTLKKGYYVRMSGAPEFSAPLGKNNGAMAVAIDAQIKADPETVYVVTIKDGQVADVTQKTK